MDPALSVDIKVAHFVHAFIRKKIIVELVAQAIRITVVKKQDQVLVSVVIMENTGKLVTVLLHHMNPLLVQMLSRQTHGQFQI